MTPNKYIRERAERMYDEVDGHTGDIVYALREAADGLCCGSELRELADLIEEIG